jgi:hypothetical protein
MGNEVKADSIWIRREGNQILVDASHYFNDHPFSPELVLVLSGESGIEIDPEWKAKVEQIRAHRQLWYDLIRKMDPGAFLSRLLYRATPPRFIGDTTGMIQYLHAIADGEVKIEGVGKKSRELLSRSFKEAFPKGTA